MPISLKEMFQEDAEEVKEILMMFGGKDAQIVSCGQRLADEGMTRAIEHADRVCNGWSSKAWNLFVRYITEVKREFMTEDVREWAHNMGLPLPPDSRAWGAIIRRASRKGIIRSIGFAPMKSSNCHANPKHVWVAA